MAWSTVVSRSSGRCTAVRSWNGPASRKKGLGFPIHCAACMSDTERTLGGISPCARPRRHFSTKLEVLWTQHLWDECCQAKWKESRLRSQASTAKSNVYVLNLENHFYININLLLIYLLNNYAYTYIQRNLRPNIHKLINYMFSLT